MNLLEEYEEKFPTRKIIFMNDASTLYSTEYIAFNFEILKEVLEKSSIAFEITEGGVLLSGISTKDVLFNCGIFTHEGTNGAILIPTCNMCDLMSACSRIISFFEK